MRGYIYIYTHGCLASHVSCLFWQFRTSIAAIGQPYRWIIIQTSTCCVSDVVSDFLAKTIKNTYGLKMQYSTKSQTQHVRHNMWLFESLVQYHCHALNKCQWWSEVLQYKGNFFVGFLLVKNEKYQKQENKKKEIK